MLENTGADGGIRTRDRRITNALLYRLSYIGVCKGKILCQGLVPIKLSSMSLHCPPVYTCPDLGWDGRETQEARSSGGQQFDARRG